MMLGFEKTVDFVFDHCVLLVHFRLQIFDLLSGAFEQRLHEVVGVVSLTPPALLRIVERLTKVINLQLNDVQVDLQLDSRLFLADQTLH